MRKQCTWLLLVAGLLCGGCAALPRNTESRPAEVKRFGMVVGVRPEKIAEYKELHANCWPGVLEAMKECHIRNFSIYLAEIEEGNHLLFGYFEYWGKAFDADMARMQTYDINKKWWKLTDACQKAVPLKEGDGLWMGMEEVFHSE
jgi:L-rhamnose mutarotase